MDYGKCLPSCPPACPPFVFFRRFASIRTASCSICLSILSSDCWDYTSRLLLLLHLPPPLPFILNSQPESTRANQSHPSPIKGRKSKANTIPKQDQPLTHPTHINQATSEETPTGTPRDTQVQRERERERERGLLSPHPTISLLLLLLHLQQQRAIDMRQYTTESNSRTDQGI